MISVKNLTKVYKTPIRKPGMKGFLKNLFSREYKEYEAVKDISFEIDKPQLVGLIGPNGAGKTSTMKMLAGVLYPTAGQISVLGHTPFKKEKEYLKQMAFVMGQKSQLIWDLPAADTFELIKEIYELEDKQYKKTVDHLAKLVDGKDLINYPVRTLSLGQRMKMELIAALIHRPKVLFLDEPTIGLDVVVQKNVRDFIKAYQEEYQATIILTSHYMEDVKQLAKRVMIINLGKIIYDGDLDKLVRRYVKEKLITVTLDKEPNPKFLKQISSSYELEYPRVTFKIKREDLTKKVEQISENLVFADINIEEERIENVIRKIFQEK